MNIYCNQNNIEVGIDEAGRGSLIGRVYAGVVLWGNKELSEYNEELKNIKCDKYLNWDSKKITKNRRKLLKEFIEKNAIDYAVGYSESYEIDQSNILKATMIAMHRALNNLNSKFDHILVDGTQFVPYYSNKSEDYISHTCIPHGDKSYLSIGAASILAKVAHDEHIELLCKENEDLNEKYDLLNNMGYGTKKHINGIEKHGISKFHRNTYKCCK